MLPQRKLGSTFWRQERRIDGSRLLPAQRAATVSCPRSATPVANYHRSVGERCSSIRHRLVGPHSWLFIEGRSAWPRQNCRRGGYCRRVCGCAGACHIPGMATKRLKRPRDPIQLGKLIVDIATGQVEDRIEDHADTVASEAKRNAGIKGGRARARSLTPSRKLEIAKTGAKARWQKDQAARGKKEPA